MNEQPVTDALVRRFLLGQTNDDERQFIESLFITDPVLKERILVAEQDLIEDYLEDCLDNEDKQSFLLQYAQTSADQRKLRIMRSVKDWAVKEADAPLVNPSEISFWNRFFAGFKLKPVFVIPIAATSLVAITIAAFWLSRKPEDGSKEHLVRQQELVQINNPASMREVLPQMKVQELTPVSVRGVEQRELTLQDNVKPVELRLAWIQQESFPSYRASIQRVGDHKLFTLDNVQAQGDGGKTIRIRLPAHFLKRGTYRIELTSIDSKGSVGSAEEYSFSVNG
jgi:hypothetical protein